MKNYKKQIGIWLDYKEAWLVAMDQEKGGAPEVQHIESEIEWGVAKGGARSKTPWGPQGGISESAHEARRKQEEKRYFESIIKAIDPTTDEIAIFGPAEAKQGLKHAMEAIKNYRPQIVAVESADSMTQNQMLAKIRDFFAEKVA